MNFNGSCNCGCGGRHSIDNVTGRPIYIEDYVIPVFKGSTLITEFQFPFELTNNDTVTITLGNPSTLNTATIVKSTTEKNLVTIRWEASVIAQLVPETPSVPNSFRLKVTNSVTGIVKTYNVIAIKLV